MVYDGQSQSDQNTNRIEEKGLRGRASSLPPSKNDIAVQDWSKMTEEEKQAFQMLNAADISPELVTNQVLKLCNIVRQSLDTR